MPINNNSIKNTGWSLKEIAKRFADGITTHSESKGEMGVILSPLINLPLNRDLYFSYGVGEVEFLRNSLGTYFDLQGIMRTAQPNVPRFGQQGLLIEYETTNLMAHSNDSTSARWTNPTNSWSGTSNNQFSPDGTKNAHKILTSKTDSIVRYEFSGTPTDTQGTLANMVAGTYTFSFYIKDMDAGIQSLEVLVGSENIDLVYSTGTDWSRQNATFTVPAFTKIDLKIGTNGSLNNCSIWGVQLEKEAGLSSLIKTTGTGLTRKADFVEVQGLNNFPNAKDVSCTIQFSPISITGGYNLLGGYDGSTLVTSFKIEDDMQLKSSVVDTDDNVSSLSSPPDYIEWEEGQTYTFGYALNNRNDACDLYLGSEILPSTNNIIEGYTPKGVVDTIVLGGEKGNSNARMSGYLKNLKVYDKTLQKASFSLI